MKAWQSRQATSLCIATFSMRLGIEVYSSKNYKRTSWCIYTRKFILTFGMLAYSSSLKDGEEKKFVTKQSPLCYGIARD
jgi:hypothetical protein